MSDEMLTMPTLRAAALITRYMAFLDENLPALVQLLPQPGLNLLFSIAATV